MVQSMDEETLLKNLNFSPYRFEHEAVKARLKTISQDWKKRIEAMKLTIAKVNNVPMT